MDTTEETRAVVKGFMEAAMAGDREKQMSYIADDIVVNTPPYLPWAGPHHGREVWQQNAIPFVRAIHDSSHMTIDYIADGEECIALIHTGLKGTDERAYYAERYTVRDGKAVALEVFCWDWRPVVKVLAQTDLSGQQ